MLPALVAVGEVELGRNLAALCPGREPEQLFSPFWDLSLGAREQFTGWSKGNLSFLSF